ncbi:hypothetical protein BDW22DRAFT_1146235 [Trametopsis cervina]|nr:hypothetical protein BDW22DRAFT_1146235 [Trametopsis cervina]
MDDVRLSSPSTRSFRRCSTTVMHVRIPTKTTVHRPTKRPREGTIAARPESPQFALSRTSAAQPQPSAVLSSPVQSRLSSPSHAHPIQYTRPKQGATIFVEFEVEREEPTKHPNNQPERPRPRTEMQLSERARPHTV